MGNERCGILEVTLVALVHMTLSFTHRISTAHIFGNRNIMSISGLQEQACDIHVTEIEEYTCNNKPRNSNSDPRNKNTGTIKAYI